MLESENSVWGMFPLSCVVEDQIQLSSKSWLYKSLGQGEIHLGDKILKSLVKKLHLKTHDWMIFGKCENLKKSQNQKKRNLKTEPLVIPTSLEQEMRESNEEKQI